MNAEVSKHKDNVYINIVMPGNSDGINNTTANYDQTFTQAILSNPSDYYASVIRFSLPLDEVPIQHVPVDVTQNNPTILVMKVAIKQAAYNHSGTVFQAPVIWNPESNAPVPVPAGSSPYFTNQQSISDYYNNFSIQNLVNCFNSAISVAMTAAGIGATAQPFYTWNPTTQLFSLVVSQAFINTGYSLGVNRAGQNYFDSFNVWFDTASASLGYMYYYNFTVQLGTTAPYTFAEDFTSVALWFDIRKILVISNGLPINNESIPSQNPTTGQINGAVTYQPILTDYILPLSNPEDLKTIAVYNPTSQYRLIDMTANSPLTKIDLNFSYQDKNGNTFPILISPHQVASLKIAFLKKSLYGTGKQLTKR